MRNIICGMLVSFALSFVSRADTVTLVPSKDTTLYERDGDSNGKGTYFFAGKTGQSKESLRRALLAFDVAGGVPVGSTISSASVTLNLSRTSNEDPVDFSLHRVMTAWGEGTSNSGGEEGRGSAATNGDATWTQAVFPSTPWTTPGGDFDSTASATMPVGGLGKYTWTSTPAFVTDVQTWLDNSVSNFGWILIGNEVTERSARRFDSREATDAANRPTLTIEFTPAGVGPIGDFNGDLVVDALDIDALTVEVLAGTNQVKFDLNNDQLVTDADRQAWVVDVKKTYFGDSNLDGVFSSGDFVAVFVAGRYEDGVPKNSGWATGDWNGDQEFDTSDFVSAFQGGGYELGPRMAVAVPEPQSLLIVVASMLMMIRSLFRPQGSAS